MISGNISSRNDVKVTVKLVKHRMRTPILHVIFYGNREKNKVKLMRKKSLSECTSQLYNYRSRFMLVG